MSKRFFWILILFFLPYTSQFGVELLFKNGDAFLVEEAVESGTYITFSWKDQKYKVPKTEIQRLDPRKKGSDSSYRYSEFQLSDGTMLKGILVEKKDSKLILKTELGFVELDTSKVASYNGDIVETPPTIPDRYIDSDGRTGTWRMGISTLGYASLGTWQQAFPLTYGGGLFLEKSSIVPGRFYGLNSDFTYGRGKAGQLSIWSQSIYLGKSYGSSSPYWILGIGASSISRSDGDDVRSTITPDTSIEFGWAWETNSKHLIRAGIRSQCHWDSGSTLCQSGIRFSWGFQI